MEEFLIGAIKEYGYIILFFWCMLEGEMALVMGGLLSHTGDMRLELAITVAALGGFAGDQLYFYIGRYNKRFIAKRLRKQRRKFAIAHILLKKHGWPIIFVQRYIYGLRTVIPISIGLTRYSARKFAFINLLSAFAWASLTIIPIWYFGDKVLHLFDVAKNHWYFVLPIVAIFILTILYTFHRIEKSILKKRKHENKSC